MNVVYPVILTKKPNSIFIYVPVLCISINAPNIKSAMFQTRKAIKHSLINIFNRWHTIPDPIDISEIRTPKNSITFLIKVQI